MINKTEVFSLMTSMSADVCLLILSEISCLATSWQSDRNRDTRPVRQLELMTALKRTSLDSVQMPEIVRFDSPSFSCKTFSIKSVFRSHSATHNETYLNFPTDNVDFDPVPFHIPEAFVERGPGSCQRLPFRAHLQSGGDQLTAQFIGSFLSATSTISSNLTIVGKLA